MRYYMQSSYHTIWHILNICVEVGVEKERQRERGRKGGREYEWMFSPLPCASPPSPKVAAELESPSSLQWHFFSDSESYVGNSSIFSFTKENFGLEYRVRVSEFRKRSWGQLRFWESVSVNLIHHRTLHHGDFMTERRCRGLQTSHMLPPLAGWLLSFC